MHTVREEKSGYINGYTQVQTTLQIRAAHSTQLMVRRAQGNSKQNANADHSASDEALSPCKDWGMKGLMGNFKICDAKDDLLPDSLL